MSSEDRKRQILGEATKLFSRHGYDKVTIKELADACGITEPALYRYFPSKEAIYDAVLASLPLLLRHQELFDRLEGVTELPDILYAMERHILDFFGAHREIYRLLLYSTLREHSLAREVYRAIREPYVSLLLGHLDRLYTEGKIRKKNNEITARCFVGSVFDCALSSTLWQGFLGNTYRLDEIVANNVPLFIEGLAVK